MKKKSAFTLVEAAITIGIMGVAFALGGVVIYNMVNIQDKSADNTDRINTISRIDDLINDYVSFVSLDTDAISFSYTSYVADPAEITFTTSTYNYKLAYSSSSLSISSNYDGEVDYLKHEKSITLSDVEYMTFAYDTSKAMLNVRTKVSGKETHLVYVFRCEL